MSTRSENIRFNVYLNDKQAGNNMGSLYKQSRMLKSELKKLEIGSAAWIKKLKQVQKVEKNLQRVRAEIRGTNSLFGRMANGFNKYFGIITAGIATFSGIIYGIKQFIQRNVELSDSLSNVRKTTGLTKKEVRSLYSEFKNFNTRTARGELLKIAEQAGRLSIKGKKNILDFVESANKINVALGDDLGDNASKAILEVGKITSNLEIATKYGVDYARAIDMAGSAINELAANTKAQAPYIISWSKRLSGVAKNAKIAAQDIFGLATTFDESGQTLEMSATAVNKVIVDMFTDTEKYAEMAGMSLEDFTNLLATDANEAFIVLLEHLKNDNEGFKVMANRLNDLGIDGARAVQAISSLAANTDTLRKNQKMANTALEEGTSLTNEYNIKNENLAGNVEKIGRKIRAWFINSKFIGWLEGAVGWMANLGKETKTSTQLIRAYYKQVASERSELELLFGALNRSGEGTETRKEAVKKINEVYADYLPNLLTEKSNLDDIAIAYNAANKGLIKNITLKARENDIQTLVNQSLSDQKDIVDEIINDISAKKGDNVAAVALGELYDIIEKIKTSKSVDDVKNIVGSFAKRYRNASQEVGLYTENLNQFIEILKLQGVEQKELNKVTLFYEQLLKKLGDDPKLKIKPDPKTEDGTTDYTKEELKKLQSLNNKIESLTRSQELAKMEANKREIELIKDKYKKLIDEAKGFDDQIKQLENLREAEIEAKKAEQQTEYNKKRKELQEQIKALSFDDREEELEANRQQFENMLALAEQYVIDNAELLEAQKLSEKAIKDKYDQKEIDATKRKNKDIAEDNHRATMGTLSTFSNVFGSIAANMKEGSKEYQTFLLFQATMDTIASAIAAYKSTAAIPIVGPVLAPVAAAAALAFGYSNVKKIKSESPSNYAKGGIAKGPSHDQGGINMIDSRTGKKVGEMEGDEPYMIFSKKTYKNNRELINALLDSSLNHDGAPVSWMHPDSLSQPNLSDIINNHRSMFGAGGVTNVTNNYSQSEIIEKNEENTLIISRLDEMLEEFKKLKYLKTLIDIDGVIKIKESLNEIETIENESQI